MADIQRPTTINTHTYRQFREKINISPSFHAQDWGGTAVPLENLRRQYANTQKSPDQEIEPRNFLLWRKSAKHYITMEQLIV